MKVAFVGLGAMGRPMAERLAAMGIAARVTDADPNLAAVFGAAWAANPAVAAEDADVLITMLPNGDVVRDVLVGSGGAAARLAPDAVVIDMSSSDAAGTIVLGAELAAIGIKLIDAPVSGGVAAAGQGTLTLMVGGDDEAAFGKASPVLEALGTKILRVGGLGAGHAAKAVNNAVAACIFAVTAEGLVLAERFGLDPTRMLEVINASTGRSGVSEGVFPSQVLTGRYALGFRLGLMAKDVALAEALRESARLDLPMLATTHACWREASSALGAAADFTAYHRHVAAANGEA